MKFHSQDWINYQLKFPLPQSHFESKFGVKPLSLSHSLNKGNKKARVFVSAFGWSSRVSRSLTAEQAARRISHPENGTRVRCDANARPRERKGERGRSSSYSLLVKVSRVRTSAGKRWRVYERLLLFIGRSCNKAKYELFFSFNLTVRTKLFVSMTVEICWKLWFWSNRMFHRTMQILCYLLS